eukprot:3907316-Rhodomonas_salina.3
MAEAAAGARLDAAFDHVRRDVNLVTTEDGAYAVTLSFVPSEVEYTAIFSSICSAMSGPDIGSAAARCSTRHTAGSSE